MTCLSVVQYDRLCPCENEVNLSIYLQKQRVAKAIAKAGSVNALARQFWVSEKTVRRWFHGMPMCMSNQAKLLAYLEN